MSSLKLVYEWHKEQLWIQLGSITLGAALIYLFDLNVLVVFAIYIFTIAKVIVGLKLMNVNPGSVNDQENFSWKYYQSLPLTKKELYNLYLLNSLFSMFPVIYWILCFHVHSAKHLLEIDPYEIQKWFPAGLLTLAGISSLLFSNLVAYPREHFTRLNKRILLYQNVRDFTFAICGMLSFGLFVGVIYRYISQFHPGLLKSIEALTSSVVSGKFGLFALGVLAVVIYFDSFRVWLDEKRRAPKLNWNLKRDLPLLALSVLLIYIPFSLLLVPRDGGLALHDAIIDNDAKKFEMLIHNEDINEKNQFGYTPIMTAAVRGRENMFKTLLKKGASTNGVALSSKRDEYDIFHLAIIGGQESIVKALLNKDNVQKDQSGSSPLHIASSLCHQEVVELLIEHGARVNELNERGQTALHRASINNCFPVAVILLENGADPLIKDKKNKLAYDYGEKSQRSPAAFIEKRAKKNLKK